MSDQNFEWRYLENEKSFFKNLKTDFHHFESCFNLRDYHFLCRNPFKFIIIRLFVIPSISKSRRHSFGTISDVIFLYLKWRK